MTPLRWIAAYGATMVVFLAVDLLWLGVIGRGIYQRHLGHMMASPPNWTAAFIFYAIFIVGIFVFAILPALERESAVHALRMGAAFGFFTYATWDLTNLAVLKDFPTAIVFIDIPWGVVLTGTVAVSGYAAARWLGA